MSIYSKQISHLTFDDILELQTENAQENVRLEFKSEFPGRHETLKKVSSMANTYGGYMVIGAGDDGNGNLAHLDGVSPVNGHKQKVIQWCYDGLAPPVSPLVSNVIPHESDPDRVFYVIHVEESQEAPHFINNRKGCYIRTDEFSQSFRPRLATYSEIRFLTNRRKQAIAMRNNLIARAEQRFSKHLEQARSQGKVADATFTLSVIPFFPSGMVLSASQLSHALAESQLKARNVHFPSDKLHSQHEGFYDPDPRYGLQVAYFESGIHGLVFYGQSALEKRADVQSKETPKLSIPSDRLLAWIVFYLRYAGRFYSNVGYNGSLMIRSHFEKVRGRTFILVNPTIRRIREGPDMGAQLDNSFTVVKETNAYHLSSELLELSRSMFRHMTFAFGWERAFEVDENTINTYVKGALTYLGWEMDELGK